MARTELTNLRTQKAKHFWDDVLQKRVAIIALHDQHYQDDSGFWQDCVEAWENDGADGFDSGMSRLRHRVRLAWLTGVFRYHPVRGAPLKYVTVGRPQRKGVGQQWPVMVLGTRSQDGPWMHFDTDAHGYDVLSTWQQVAFDYRLKDSSAPTRLRWQLTFSNLTFDWASREVRDGATVVSRLLPTIAYDANGANVPVTESWNGTYLELNIDTTGAVFPITVDPTFTDGPSGDVTTSKDSYIYQNLATTNYGTGTNMVMRGNSSYLTRPLLEFTLTTLEGATTSDRKLYVYQDIANYGADTSLIDIYRLLQSWTEAGVTWNTYDGTNNWPGSAGASTAGTDRSSTSMGTITWDREGAIGTEYVINLDQTEFEAMVAANSGLIIVSTYNGDTGRMSSSNHATTGQRPKLVVVYATGGGTRTATPITTALKGIFTRTASTLTAALKYTGTRTVTPITAALSGTFTRTASSVTAALAGTFTRTISSVTAALSHTSSRTITPITTALQGTFTRTATPITAALSGTFTRVASVTAALSGTFTRTITPITASLTGRLTRTASTITASLISTLTCTASSITAALASTFSRTATSVTASLSIVTVDVVVVVTLAASRALNVSLSAVEATTVTLSTYAAQSVTLSAGRGTDFSYLLTESGDFVAIEAGGKLAMT